MENALYLKSCYLKEFEAEVVKADGKSITLSKTAFYPSSGGQPNDNGIIRRESDGKAFHVINVRKENGGIIHELDSEGLSAGDKVHCTIDWERRYRLMRYHTGSHILDGVVQKATGALVTGNQLAIDKTRIDFALENFDKGMLKDFEDKANEIISRNLPVHIKFLTREEVLKRPEMIKLAMGLPENQAEFRIIEIEGFDSQPCGGTHLKNTGEVGRIRITGAENKGKSNRRISFVVE